MAKVIFVRNATTGHKNRKFAGFHVDPADEYLLLLASIGRGKTIAELLRTIVNTWLLAQGGHSYIIKEIVNRAFEVYLHINKYGGGIEKTAFIDQMETDLIKMKVNSDTIEDIINKFNGKIKKNKNKVSEIKQSI